MGVRVSVPIFVISTNCLALLALLATLLLTLPILPLPHAVRLSLVSIPSCATVTAT